jgi:type II secretory pathway pseudopilin PulG
MPTRADSGLSRSDPDRRGVTLFEAVAAMAIVGMTAIGALEAAGAQMRAAERARRAVEAASLAQQRLDWLEFLSETQLRALPDTVKEGVFPEPLDEYSWETEAEPYPTQAGVYRVAVRVYWERRAQNFELKTYAYRRPVIQAGVGGRGGRGGR